MTGANPSLANPSLANLTLAIETATPYLALGLLGPATAHALLREVGRRHAEQLPDALDELLTGAGAGRHQITRLVVGTGPGSYTGVRVGASFALGLGRALGAKVLGVSTLEALIGPQLGGRQAVSLDARKEQLYGALYEVSGGVVVRALRAPARHAVTDFAAQVAGTIWRRDPAPDALALARAGEAHGASEWVLQYL
ncbi:tRNA (adenosine(37)-N6)-threonylcarbamoyltransferase complex dimerization subunit type 1 TsaB [Deinococcus sp.]|uniref:tRNA (adenosine(37)-N6)-threonylcarbamoyltransferase complex dimerization subunit type 1 TsaB n=1 Tax=Deinococcus sp. TaxID=47478 RepID=UPI0025D09189|nr:tRNA (adenosine(37)-N6)-threonylcarbamoyltransferase complex dimerization subunit type 1 TsaB [Deinococcus sp.]